MAASMTITSGFSAAASWMASSPLLASPTTRSAGIVLEEPLEAAPNERMVVGQEHADGVAHAVPRLVFERHRQADARAAGRPALDAQRAPHQRRTLAHGGQPEAARRPLRVNPFAGVFDLERQARSR